MFIDVYRVNNAQFQHFVHFRSLHQQPTHKPYTFCIYDARREFQCGVFVNLENLILGHETEITLAKAIIHS